MLKRRTLLLGGTLYAASGIPSLHSCTLAKPFGLRSFLAGDETLLAKPLTVPKDFVGIHLHSWPFGNPAAPIPAPTYEYGAVRSHDYGNGVLGLRWCTLNPAPGVFYWDLMDSWVATHAAGGKSMMFTLYGTPGWLSTDLSHRDPYLAPGGAAPPKNLGAVQDFIRALVTRYNGGSKKNLRYLEIWNEPHFNHDYSAFWWGSAADLAGLGRVVYRTAKGIDPNIHVLSPAFAEGFDPALSFEKAIQQSDLYQYCTASDGAGGVGRDTCDGISVHLYNASARSHTSNILGLKKLLGGMNLSLPIYMTELGFIVPNDAFQPLNMNEKATLLRRIGVRLAAAGVQGVYFYGHDDELIGNPSKHVEIAQAIDDMQKHLAGNTLTSVTALSDGTVNVISKRGNFKW